MRSMDRPVVDLSGSKMWLTQQTLFLLHSLSLEAHQMNAFEERKSLVVEFVLPIKPRSLTAVLIPAMFDYVHLIVPPFFKLVRALCLVIARYDVMNELLLII